MQGSEPSEREMEGTDGKRGGGKRVMQRREPTGREMEGTDGKRGGGGRFLG